jgi:hypothetical protein
MGGACGAPAAAESPPSEESETEWNDETATHAPTSAAWVMLTLFPPSPV